MERKDAEIDGEVGVAVVFDEEEEDEEDEEGYEIQEEVDDEEEEGEDETKEAGEGEQDISADELVIGGSSAASQAGKAKADKDVVSPHTIDGFWVQRQISEVYPVPVTVADKATAILSILASESGLRDCKNEYQSFHVITKFLKKQGRHSLVY